MVGVDLDVLCLLSRCATSICDSGTSLVDVANMNRIDAARFVNQHAARALRKLETDRDWTWTSM
jgi:hypothetical protein